MYNVLTRFVYWAAALHTPEFLALLHVLGECPEAEPLSSCPLMLFCAVLLAKCIGIPMCALSSPLLVIPLWQCRR
jgi:hypothetical protein